MHKIITRIKQGFHGINTVLHRKDVKKRMFKYSLKALEFLKLILDIIELFKNIFK